MADAYARTSDKVYQSDFDGPDVPGEVCIVMQRSSIRYDTARFLKYRLNS